MKGIKGKEWEDLNDWDVLCRFLPAGWEAEARKRGALRRARSVKDASALLRLLMIHLFHGCSLIETSVRARQTGLAEVSSVAIYKRLRASEEWLRWLAESLCGQTHGPAPRVERAVRAMDATTVSEPGSTGTDWRVHYLVNLATLRCDFFELTDCKGGEKAQRFPVEPGDLMVGDRVYAGAPGIAHVVGKQGDVLARWNLSRPLRREAGGGKVDLLRLFRGLRVGEVAEHRLGVAHRGDFIAGRLIVVKRTRKAAEFARRRVRRKLRRGRRMAPEVWRAAQYFFVWTTAFDADLDARTLLELYRRRWQIELVFKRLKSIMGLGHLPKTDPASARAWLHGKLLAGLLAERIIAEAGAFSPWGYPLERPPQPLA